MERRKKNSNKPSVDLKHTVDDLFKGEVSPFHAGGELFSVGYQLDLDGQTDAADAIYRQTIEMLESISDQDGNSIKLSEHADLAFNHGKNQYKLGRYSKAQTAFKRSVELIDSMILLDACYQVIRQLADSLVWLARSERKAGNISNSIEHYERAIGIWNNLLGLPHSTRSKRQLKNRLGKTIFGYSKSLKAAKRSPESQDALADASDLLKLNLNQLGSSTD